MTADPVPALAGDLELCWERLRRGLWEYAVKFGEGVDRIGRPLAWLMDCRETLLTSAYLPDAGRLVWDRVRRYAPDLVGGLTMAADPLTVAVLHAAAADGVSLGGFAVRRKPKRHGLKKLVEGQPVRPGSRVVLLDDVISSGRSLSQAFEAVTAAGAVVVAAVVLVDYGRARLPRFARLRVPLEAVFTLQDLGLAVRQPAGLATDGPSWRYPVAAEHTRLLDAGPCAGQRADAVVAVTAGAGALVSLDRDGGQRWRYPATHEAGGFRTAATVCHDRVLVGDSTGVIHCVDSDTGLPVWKSAVGGRLIHPVAVDHDRVLVASAMANLPGRLTAIRFGDGLPAWTRDLPAGLSAEPVADGQLGEVMIGLTNGRVLSVCTEKGQTRWAAHTEAMMQGRPAFDPDLLFCPGSDGVLRAVARHDGALVWRRRLSDRLRCSPVVAGPLVLVGANHRLIAVARSSGRVQWIAPVAGRVIGGVSAVSRGQVAVGSVRGDLSLIDAASGRVRRAHHTGGPIRSTPTLCGNFLTVTSGDGYLYAFDLAEGADL